MFRILRSIEGLWTPRNSFGLFDNAGVEGEAGSEGAGGGEGGQQPVEGEQGSDGSRAPGGQGGSHMIPKSRFDEVNNSLKAFKDLGLSAEQIRNMQQRMKWMEENPGKRYTDKETDAIQRELLQVPAVAKAVQMADRYDKYMERLSKNYVSDGNKQTESFLKELGREVNDKSRNALTNALSGIISSDKEMMERFMSFDPSVFKDAFLAFKESMGLAAPPKIPGAALQSKKVPSKPVGPGKAPSGKEPANEPPKSERDLLDEAGDNAFDLLQAHGSQ